MVVVEVESLKVIFVVKSRSYQKLRYAKIDIVRRVERRACVSAMPSSLHRHADTGLRGETKYALVKSGRRLEMG